MRLLLKNTATMLAALVGLLCVVSMAAEAQTASSPAPAHSISKMPHRVVIQVSEEDPMLMNLALNNAENLTKFYKDRGETVQIEFVAYGPGLAMMRSDTSPVKARLTHISNSMKNVTFSGCGNTMANQSAKENKTVSLVPEAHVVTTGVARIVELQELGWTYVRP
jgi:uncharacterized protein